MRRAGHRDGPTSAPDRARTGGSREFHPVLSILLDVVGPVAAFFLLRLVGVPTVAALLVGTSLSLVIVAYGVVRRRRVDAVAVLVGVLFVAGLVTTLLTDDPRILLAKPAVFFVAIGGWFLLSCLTGRPLMYQLVEPVAVREGRGGAARFAATWAEVPEFRRLLRTMSVLWGLVWLAESVLRVVVVYSFPVERVDEALVWTLVVIAALVVPAVVATVVLGRRLGVVGERFEREWAARPDPHGGASRPYFNADGR